MPTSKSRSRHHRSKWAHCNTPDALRRRRATMDARREERTRDLPPACIGPEPLSLWQTVLVLGSDGSEHQRIELYVPARGSGARCDQHAATVNGAQRLITATEVGRVVAAAILKRPSFAVLAEARSAELAGLG